MRPGIDMTMETLLVTAVPHIYLEYFQASMPDLRKLGDIGEG
jgi:hypothetical protein